MQGKHIESNNRASRMSVYKKAFFCTNWQISTLRGSYFRYPLYSGVVNCRTRSAHDRSRRACGPPWGPATHPARAIACALAWSKCYHHHDFVRETLIRTKPINDFQCKSKSHALASMNVLQYHDCNAYNESVMDLWFLLPPRNKFGKTSSRLPLFTLESENFKCTPQGVTKIEDPSQIRYRH